MGLSFEEKKELLLSAYPRGYVAFIGNYVTEEVRKANPKIVYALPLIVEGGKVKAVVMEIEQFQLLTRLLETMEDEDVRSGGVVSSYTILPQAAQLAKLPIFKKAVKEGLEAVKEEKNQTLEGSPCPPFG